MKDNYLVNLLILAVFIIGVSASLKAQTLPSKLLYGVAYYDEYMPYQRLDKDILMMKAAGINVVRIAESTWSTVEPAEGVFNFTHIDRVLDAMQQAGIYVIIGTPTYAIPSWLVKKYPDILAITSKGQNQYGARQNMDITNIHFRTYAEKVIRKILEHVKNHPAIIGYQVDNETKAYGTSGPNVQALFVNYLKAKFLTTDSLNKAFGLDYWSNRVDDWNDFPSVNGSINASLVAEFAKFQRKQVTDYLGWQAAIVRGYKKPSQFITQNFDLDWSGYSYGIQPDVNHFDAAKVMDIAGIDIYHPTQDHLTGIEISLGGDLARSMKRGRNYLVIETQAQGFAQWLPYPGQLRLQAFSHLASGADMVSYWHWHSIHNAAETYWKGLLSHDFEPNATYEEAKTIGADFKRLSPELINLQKKNQVAILFSNEALTGFNAFSFGWGSKVTYNDILRPYYDALYRQNVGVDFVDPSSVNLEQYKLLIVPALYAAPDSLLSRLNRFVKNGGHILYTFKSGFSNQDVKVRTVVQPGLISEVCGIKYGQFTLPENVSFKGNPFGVNNADNAVQNWIELITPTTATVLARYDHPVWGSYAAITQNSYGNGVATYVGCMTSDAVIEKLIENTVRKAGLWAEDQELKFPIITKSGMNQTHKMLHYYFNYSDKAVNFIYSHKKAIELLSGTTIEKTTMKELAPWGVQIMEEE